MRKCKCGAPLDFAPDETTRCWECRDRIEARAKDVQKTLAKIVETLARKAEKTAPVQYAWWKKCDTCGVKDPFLVQVSGGLVLCPACAAK